MTAVPHTPPLPAGGGRGGRRAGQMVSFETVTSHSQLCDNITHIEVSVIRSSVGLVPL